MKIGFRGFRGFRLLAGPLLTYGYQLLQSQLRVNYEFNGHTSTDYFCSC